MYNVSLVVVHGIALCSIYLVGVFVLLVTSIPACLAAGAGLSGFIYWNRSRGCERRHVAFHGYDKQKQSFPSGLHVTDMPIDLADQYPNFEDRIATTKDGRRVLVTRDLTVEKIYHIYYW